MTKSFWVILNCFWLFKSCESFTLGMYFHHSCFHAKLLFLLLLWASPSYYRSRDSIWWYHGVPPYGISWCTMMSQQYHAIRFFVKTSNHFCICVANTFDNLNVIKRAVTGAIVCTFNKSTYSSLRADCTYQINK